MGFITNDPSEHELQDPRRDEFACERLKPGEGSVMLPTRLLMSIWKHLLRRQHFFDETKLLDGYASHRSEDGERLPFHFAVHPV